MVKIQLLSGQRVGVFIDVQNLYYSAKYLYKTKVNFNALLKRAVNGRTLVRAICYVIKADAQYESNFFDALKKIGFEVRSKDLQVFYGGAKKGDWDVGIAMDMIESAPKLDVAVLVSGDGDFIDLVQHLRRGMGCKVEAIAFGKSASSKLKDTCDDFIDLDKDAKKYLITDVKTSEGSPRAKSRVFASSDVIIPKPRSKERGFAPSNFEVKK